MPTPRPVSALRIKEMLHGRDMDSWEDHTDNGQSLMVAMPNAIFIWDASDPHILHIRAHWRGEATNTASFDILSREVASCNSLRTGPKAYLSSAECGERFTLVAECNILTISGLTERQLNAFAEASMTMILSFFADLEAAHPEFVTWED